MSGLQEIAAILGIAESTFRSISKLYAFLAELKHVPFEIERLREETETLKRTLLSLSFLQFADEDTRRLVQRIGLPATVGRCNVSCDKLYQYFHGPVSTDRFSWRFRFQFLRHKKAVEGVLAEIYVAKQTTILTIVVTQL